MSFLTAEANLGSAVATSGTFTVAYPVDANGSATSAGTFENARDHKLWVNDHQALYSQGSGFTLAFGTANITVTYLGSTTIPAGSRVNVQLDILGANSDAEPALPAGVAKADTVILHLGAPDAADVDGVLEAFSGAAGALTLDGALTSGGVATLDVPRNLVADSGGADTAVLTITGTDAYGATLVEAITLNGTTAVPGKKAFKTVTGIVSSATIANGAFVGTGDVLGLPVRLPDTGYILAELEDGAAATAGTAVAAVDTVATSTTGDVRGTYDPNSAADGSKSFKLIVAGADAADKGVAQFAG